MHSRPSDPARVKRVKHNNENTCNPELIGWHKETTETHSTLHITMQPPNMDDLNLSDSDTDALFDTPAARKNKQKAQGAAAEAGADAAAGKARAKESHYTTEEAREAALRRELESVRNVNKVIEGVVESLQKAKDNMGVSTEVQRCMQHTDNRRPSQRPSKTPRRSSRHGLAYCHRLSIISD